MAQLLWLNKNPLVSLTRGWLSPALKDKANSHNNISHSLVNRKLNVLYKGLRIFMCATIYLYYCTTYFESLNFQMCIYHKFLSSYSNIVVLCSSNFVVEQH